MKAKGFIVLKRSLGGDYDLLCTLYGSAGLISLYVRNALLPSNQFFGVFEPFNVVGLEFFQRGNLTLPLDVKWIKRYSYMAKDYRRFIWMSNLAAFALKYLRFYDDRVYELLEKSLTRDISSPDLDILRFKLEFTRIYGILPKFLHQELGAGKSLGVNLKDGHISPKGDIRVRPAVLRLLQRVYTLLGKDSKRLKAHKSLCKDAEKLLDAYIEYHVR